MHLYGKMLKVDYSETMEVYDVKVGISNKLMEIYMYQRSRPFFDFCPNYHSDFINLP